MYVLHANVREISFLFLKPTVDIFKPCKSFASREEKVSYFYKLQRDQVTHEYFKQLSAYLNVFTVNTLAVGQGTGFYPYFLQSQTKLHADNSGWRKANKVN